VALEDTAPDRTTRWPRFASQAEYQAALEADQSLYAARWQWGQWLAATCETPGRYGGHCRLCERETDFLFNPGPRGEVNLREELSCSQCALNARVRVVLHLLKRYALPGGPARVYLTEQTTHLYKFVRERWPEVVGSEYFDDSLRQRLAHYLKHLVSERELLRHEDVTALSFDDRALDVIISCDVLEHVPDYRQALEEFARVLKPGGRLLLTVPFMDQSADTTVRARLRDDGSIEHLEEPEYHGDPVDPNGVLAFYNFGWDLLDDVRSAGFSEACWILPWAPDEGLFSGLWTLEAVR